MPDKRYWEKSSDRNSSEESSSGASEKPVVKKRPGPKKLPERWTRLIHDSGEKPAEVSLHSIEEDVAQDKKKRTRGGSPEECAKRLLFHPGAFATAHGDLACEDWAFSEAALVKMGKKVTALRARLRVRARLAEKREEKELPEEEKDQSRLAQRMEAGYYAPSAAKTTALSRKECVEPVQGLSCKGLRKTRLTFEEKIGILHKLFVDREYQSVIAREYQVTQATICNLSKQYRSGEDWFGNLQRK
jgi:hypothetical protein